MVEISQCGEEIVGSGGELKIGGQRCREREDHRSTEQGCKNTAIKQHADKEVEMLIAKKNENERNTVLVSSIENKGDENL